jgi:YegS/Rv2252/BmrU family lipid kinase
MLQSALQQAGIIAELEMTAHPGDAARLARQGRDAGVDVLAVVGGDGTLSEAAQAYVDDAGRAVEGPEFAVVPAGTGGDFRRTFQFSDNLAQSIARIARGSTRVVDLGVAELEKAPGERMQRAFLNIASFGLSGAVDRLVNDSPKWLGGRATFWLASVRATLTYQNLPVEIRVDGAPWFRGKVLTVALANGRYFGGGMKVAPDAEIDDGLLDVVALCDLSRIESVALTSKIYQGKHIGQPEVRATRGRHVEARVVNGRNTVPVDVDGELPGALPLSARILEGALRVRV